MENNCNCNYLCSRFKPINKQTISKLTSFWKGSKVGQAISVEGEVGGNNVCENQCQAVRSSGNSAQLTSHRHTHSHTHTQTHTCRAHDKSHQCCELFARVLWPAAGARQLPFPFPCAHSQAISCASNWQLSSLGYPLVFQAF